MAALLAEDPEVIGGDVEEVDPEVAEEIADHVKIGLHVEIGLHVKTVDQERTAHHVKIVGQGRNVLLVDQEKIDPHASRRRVSRHAVIAPHVESLVEKGEVDVVDPEVLLLAGEDVVVVAGMPRPLTSTTSSPSLPWDK